MGDGFAGACGIVVRSSPETLRIRGVEAVAGGKAGDSGEYEVMTCLYHCLYGWGRLVSIRRGICRMGWVGG